jgi:hypothetical protein
MTGLLTALRCIAFQTVLVGHSESPATRTMIDLAPAYELPTAVPARWCPPFSSGAGRAAEGAGGPGPQVRRPAGAAVHDTGGEGGAAPLPLHPALPAGGREGRRAAHRPQDTRRRCEPPHHI